MISPTRFHEGGRVYLNNRYHDPTLGVFLSVDPLVSMTGQPYIYANGNPMTLSDPLGLAACEDEGNCPWSTGKCTKLCGPGHLNDKQRTTISKNPDRFSQVLWDCWYQGASGCEGMREEMGHDDGLLDAAQLILLGFAQQGGFAVDGEYLMSPYYSDHQNVNFVTGIGANGEVVVSLVHAPSADFKHMAAGGLQVIGTAMSVVAIGGLVACGVTGGGGCLASSIAGGLSTAAGSVSAGIVCSDGASTSCAWGAGTAVASLATMGAASVAQSSLRAAGLFQGGIAQAYRAGDVYANVAVSMFDIASYGIIVQHDDTAGVHMFGVVM